MSGFFNLNFSGPIGLAACAGAGLAYYGYRKNDKHYKQKSIKAALAVLGIGMVMCNVGNLTIEDCKERFKKGDIYHPKTNALLYTNPSLEDEHYTKVSIEKGRYCPEICTAYLTKKGLDRFKEENNSKEESVDEIDGCLRYTYNPKKES